MGFAELARKQVKQSDLRRPGLSKRVKPEPRVVTVDPTREDLLFVIHEACYSLYYISDEEQPSFVPEMIVQSCAYLEMVCPNEQYYLKRPSPRHVAAACVYLSMQFLSDHLCRLAVDMLVSVFRRCDVTMDKQALAVAKAWLLRKLGYGAWLTRTLFEKDADIAYRSLVEIGFLAEICFHPQSVSRMEVCDPDVLEALVSQNEAYAGMRTRLRAFCRNPEAFRRTHFRWTIK